MFRVPSMAGCLCGAALLIAAGCRDQKSDPGVSQDEARRLLEAYEKKKAEQERRERTAGSARPAASAGAPPREGPPPDDSSAPTASAPEEPGSAPSARAGQPSEPIDEQPWIEDEPTPIAPAAPARATPRGVVLYNREDEVFLASLGSMPRGKRSAPSPIRALPKSAAPFPLGRAPGVIEDEAYWITNGKLVRRRFTPKPGPLQVLRTDARDGTRVATPAPWPATPARKVPKAVAYILRPAKEDDPLRGELWVEGGATASLTPEGNSTHAVALQQTESGLLLLSVQARMAMTPIHARSVTLERQKPVLGPDTVVWVGGGVQPMTELTIIAAPPRGLWGFLPHERSITEYGLARLDLGIEPDHDTPTSWISYPNGLDPAPVSAGTICGEPAVLYAQPAHAAPDAPQELVLSTADGKKRQTLSTAKAYFDVSLSHADGGALVAYVADWVTWAVTVRCKKAPARQ